MAVSPLAFFTLGFKGPAADERRRNKALLEAKNQAEIDALAGKPSEAPKPPGTSASSSAATVDATTAAERQRKRAAAGNFLIKPPAAGTAAGANLAPRTLSGS